MIPIGAILWLMSYVFRLMFVAVAIQSLGLLAAAHTWHDRGFLALMVIPGALMLALWFRRGGRSACRLYRRARG